jgi:hypothetical protein
VPFALTIAEGKGRGRRFRFDRDRVDIGRSASNDVVLNHGAVSRVHARIERQGGGWVLLDRASANGLELNGAGVAGRVALREGDRIAVGPVTFRFCLAKPGRLGLRWWDRISRPARSGVAAMAVLLAGSATLHVRWAAQDGVPARVAAGRGTAFATGGGRYPRGSDVVAARTAYERGRRKLEERRVAPRNLYDAWRAFLEAQEALGDASDAESLPGELGRLVAACERDLRQKCDALIFRASRFERYGELESEQRTWREALLHFPGDDPGGCRRRAMEGLFSAPTDDGAG